MSDPVTNPAVERVMGMVREWNHAVYLYNRHDNQNVSECDAKYEIIRAEIAAMVALLQRAQVRLDHFDSGEDDETGRLINDIHAALRGKTTTPNPANGGGDEE